MQSFLGAGGLPYSAVKGGMLRALELHTTKVNCKFLSELIINSLEKRKKEKKKGKKQLKNIKKSKKHAGIIIK